MTNDVRPRVVLVIDIDADIERVLGTGQIAGEESVEKAILEYGVREPEDPDLNAMMAGLQVYRRLSSEGKPTYILVVAGHPTNRLEAHRRIKKAVAEFLESIGAKEAEFYIVSDGEDELIIGELLRDYGSIAGFKRVVVEQHLGIEGSYMLLIKYLKKAAIDARFSKYVLGVPGIALASMALLSLLGLADIAIKVLLLIIGIGMVVRGFNLEEPLERTLKSILVSMREVPHLNIAGLITLILFTASGLAAAYYSTKGGSGVVGVFKYTMPLISAGALSYIIISRIFYRASLGDLNIWRDVAGALVAIGLAIAFYNLGDFLDEVGGFAGSEAGRTLSNALIESGFMQYTIAFTGVAAIIEMMARATKRLGRSS